MKKLVLFDIDGTILLSSGAGRRAIIAALAEDIGIHESWGQVRFDGKTDPQILVELLEAAGQADPRQEERLRALGRKYVALLRAELARPGHRTSLMPGIPALLDRVEREEFAVTGLLTGNFAEGAALKLESGGIDPRRFRVGAYGSDSARRADLPPIAARRAEPIFGRIPTGHEVVIVGDTARGPPTAGGPETNLPTHRGRTGAPFRQAHPRPRALRAPVRAAGPDRS
jgi:phosphoglycolate phosphatase-like HAD superfamily hydrolase